jgi:hypothetical protein
MQSRCRGAGVQSMCRGSEEYLQGFRRGDCAGNCAEEVQISSQDLSRDLAKLVCIGVDVHWYSIPMYCFSRICHLFSRNLIFY